MHAQIDPSTTQNKPAMVRIDRNHLAAAQEYSPAHVIRTAIQTYVTGMEHAIASDPDAMKSLLDRIAGPIARGAT